MLPMVRNFPIPMRVGDELPGKKYAAKVAELKVLLDRIRDGNGGYPLKIKN